MNYYGKLNVGDLFKKMGEIFILIRIFIYIGYFGINFIGRDPIVYIYLMGQNNGG
jgi:hypothetical protein